VAAGAFNGPALGGLSPRKVPLQGSHYRFAAACSVRGRLPVDLPSLTWRMTTAHLSWAAVALSDQ
jgi:hypothetical protein